MKPSICAIIPTCNRAAMLRECLDSVVSQTRVPDRIIVVNDGSTDETQSVAQSFGDRVTLINKPNGGKSSALNLALHQCKEDFVWICDDDDLAAPGALAHLAAGLEANPQAGFIFGTFEIFRDEAGRRVHSPPTYWMRKDEPNIHIQFLEEMFTFQFAMLVRLSLYEKVGPFREDLIRAQDHEMAIRFARAARGIFIPQVIFFQRVHDGQRGMLAAPFDSSANTRKWLEYGQTMIAAIRKDYRIEEFTPSFARDWDSTRAKRAALVERACVCAARALWDEAIADFLEAASVSAAPASPEEMRLAEIIIRRPLPWEILGEHKEWITTLQACYRENGFSGDIIFAACRPLVWHTRKRFQDGDFKGGLQMLRMMIRILGLHGMFGRVLASLIG
jgi:hypothetical protein